MSFITANWKDREIQHCGTFNEKSKSCVVMIPVYKENISNVEKASLKQCVRILGDKYELVLVCPDSLKLTQYTELTNGYSFSFLRCNSMYFRGQKSYSDLCETWEWYNCFKEYDYMLIYQLDAWIFEDNLDYFINLGYDYIGAPHLIGNTYPDGRNGNGGFSLRKIQKFIDVCKKVNFPAQSYKLLEDRVFTEDLGKEFNLAPINICREFSFQDEPEQCFKKNDSKLPMGCHKFQYASWRNGFWQKYINVSNSEIKLDLQADKTKLSEEIGYNVSNGGPKIDYKQRVVRKFR